MLHRKLGPEILIGMNPLLFASRDMFFDPRGAPGARIILTCGRST